MIARWSGQGPAWGAAATWSAQLDHERFVSPSSRAGHRRPPRQRGPRRMSGPDRPVRRGRHGSITPVRFVGSGLLPDDRPEEAEQQEAAGEEGDEPDGAVRRAGPDVGDDEQQDAEEHQPQDPQEREQVAGVRVGDAPDPAGAAFGRDGRPDHDQEHDGDQGGRHEERDGRDREIGEGREEELQATDPQLAAMGGTMLADWMGPTGGIGAQRPLVSAAATTMPGPMPRTATAIHRAPGHEPRT